MKLRSTSPYSVWMQENADQNNSKYEHFLGSEFKPFMQNVEKWSYKL